MREENEQTHPSSIAAASNVYVCVCAGVCVCSKAIPVAAAKAP